MSGTNDKLKRESMMAFRMASTSVANLHQRTSRVVRVFGRALSGTDSTERTHCQSGRALAGPTPARKAVGLRIFRLQPVKRGGSLE